MIHCKPLDSIGGNSDKYFWYPIYLKIMLYKSSRMNKENNYLSKNKELD